MALLADGANDSMFISTFYTDGGGSSRSGSEADWFDGGFTGEFDPDLAGAEISHFIFHLDELRLDSPGTDPNHDGIWTDYEFDVRVVVMGRP